MLRDGQVSSGRVSTAIACIDRNSGALKTLVEDLVDLSRASTGKLKITRQHIELLSVVREAMNGIEPAAHAKSIDVVITVNGEPAIVDGDAIRLRQVFWNLLSNAVKFTPANGRVMFRVATTNQEVEISVSDNGQGIAPEFLPHIFEPFSQADGAGPGLGLGLAIVQQLVTAHDGRISAASPRMGAGAVFTVALPVVAVSELV
jgi:signal transduction histidine kinase